MPITKNVYKRTFITRMLFTFFNIKTFYTIYFEKTVKYSYENIFLRRNAYCSTFLIQRLTLDFKGPGSRSRWAEGLSWHGRRRLQHLRDRRLRRGRLLQQLSVFQRSDQDLARSCADEFQKVDQAYVLLRWSCTPNRPKMFIFLPYFFQSLYYEPN